MNQIQTNFLAAREAWNTATMQLPEKEWGPYEDVYLKAEQALVEWALDEAEKTGKIPPDQLKTLRDKWHIQSERIVELALSWK